MSQKNLPNARNSSGLNNEGLDQFGVEANTLTIR